VGGKNGSREHNRGVYKGKNIKIIPKGDRRVVAVSGTLMPQLSAKPSTTNASAASGTSTHQQEQFL